MSPQAGGHTCGHASDSSVDRISGKQQRRRRMRLSRSLARRRHRSRDLQTGRPTAPERMGWSRCAVLARVRPSRFVFPPGREIVHGVAAESGSPTAASHATACAACSSSRLLADTCWPCLAGASTLFAAVHRVLLVSSGTVVVVVQCSGEFPKTEYVSNEGVITLSLVVVVHQ